MSTVDGRKALHAYVSDESHSAWHEYAEEEGVSVSALLEVVGDDIRIALESERSIDRDPVRSPLAAMVKRARKIDARRRRRVNSRRPA